MDPFICHTQGNNAQRRAQKHRSPYRNRDDTRDSDIDPRGSCLPRMPPPSPTECLGTPPHIHDIGGPDVRYPRASFYKEAPGFTNMQGT